MGQLLAGAFDGRVQFELPTGGLAVWLRFDPAVSLSRLAELAHAERVRFQPGSAFATDGQPVQGARLGFASLDEAELRRGVQRLAAAFAKLR
jgi:GntR family transcriptional regulator/MocR family aminotransferase